MDESRNEDVISSNLWEETLLIDFDLISTVSSSAHQDELSKLNSALKNWGCFQVTLRLLVVFVVVNDQVINHCMTNLFLDELLDICRQFFALPLEEKLKSAMEEDIFNGYGNPAVVLAGDKPINWNDRLFLTVYPEDQRKLPFGPQKPDKFSNFALNLTLSHGRYHYCI
ncbi:probable 2-oxoglutarate-dependent dioxygenase ANS [Chenopodium quinoa]|uniref:probable 2-oxoglutarate-dependent dioxygenase ANS n=1 Tax=Chenopodium quinoa TaxID=63459 RepID=UPI000B783E65|nr:probable 2-oxoglutarate-dependent dioxygenase ANS [Chenopodium quinoa]